MSKKNRLCFTDNVSYMILCICISVHLYICISIYLYICIFVYLYICISIYLYTIHLNFKNEKVSLKQWKKEN